MLFKSFVWKKVVLTKCLRHQLFPILSLYNVIWSKFTKLFLSFLIFLQCFFLMNQEIILKLIIFMQYLGGFFVFWRIKVVSVIEPWLILIECDIWIWVGFLRFFNFQNFIKNRWISDLCVFKDYFGFCIMLWATLWTHILLFEIISPIEFSFIINRCVWNFIIDFRNIFVFNLKFSRIQLFRFLNCWLEHIFSHQKWVCIIMLNIQKDLFIFVFL